MEMGSDVALWEWILKICACLPFSPAEVWPAPPQHVLFVSKMRKEHHLCPENKFYGGKNVQHRSSVDDIYWLYHGLELQTGLLQYHVQSLLQNI